MQNIERLIMNNIVRFGVSIDEKLLSRFDTIITGKGYVNRSEAIRDLIRDMLVSEDIANPESESIGTLTLVYSHDVHELSEKLNDIQHHYHRIIVSTTHIHLDEHNCLEVLILRGKARDVQTIADKLLAIKNVRHGKLSVTSAGKNLR
jgi:CopG family transcriptional regulator, nickel-responsive regulator